MRQEIKQLLTLRYGKGLPERNRQKGDVPVLSSSGNSGSHNVALVEGPGVVIGRKGSVGTVYYVDGDFFPIDTVFYFTQQDTQLDLKYLFYRLGSLKLSELNSDSAVPGLSRDRLYSIEINVPHPEEQRRIAAILTSLDDKIELLRRQNHALEELAQTLFKRWFVDFEFPNADGQPYRSSGGAMVESELGEIPEGWEVRMLSDYVDIRYGKNLPTSKLLPIGYPVFGGNGMIGRYTDYLFVEQHVLVSCRGEASGRVNISLPKSYVTNNSLVLVPRLVTFEYLKYYSLFRKNGFKEFVTGSAQPQITIESLSKCSLLGPELDQVNAFTIIVRPIISITLLIQQQLGLFTEFRDAILGEIIL